MLSHEKATAAAPRPAATESVMVSPGVVYDENVLQRHILPPPPAEAKARIPKTEGKTPFNQRQPGTTFKFQMLSELWDEIKTPVSDFITKNNDRFAVRSQRANNKWSEAATLISKHELLLTPLLLGIVNGIACGTSSGCGIGITKLVTTFVVFSCVPHVYRDVFCKYIVDTPAKTKTGVALKFLGGAALSVVGCFYAAGKAALRYAEVVLDEVGERKAKQSGSI